MNYTIGQTICTLIDARSTGQFQVYEIVGFAFELVEARCKSTGEIHFLHPDKIELFSTETSAGTISIGDQVICEGHAGIRTLMGFYESRSTSELKGLVFDGDLSIPCDIELIRKFNSVQIIQIEV